MSGIRSKLSALYAIDQQAAKNTWIHRRHPLAKITATLLYLVCVISLDRHQLSQLTAFLFPPILLTAMADLSAAMIARRTLVALPFACLAGLGNLFLEPQPFAQFASFTLTKGAISFLDLILTTACCVSSVIILVATTPFPHLTEQLRRLHIPTPFIALLEIMMRYLSTLLDEGATMLTAFRLRAPRQNSPNIAQFAPLAGQLLLRSIAHAEHIWHAMQCRGYQLQRPPLQSPPWTCADTLFLSTAAAATLTPRLIDFPAILGQFL